MILNDTQVNGILNATEDLQIGDMSVSEKLDELNSNLEETNNNNTWKILGQTVPNELLPLPEVWNEIMVIVSLPAVDSYSKYTYNISKIAMTMFTGETEYFKQGSYATASYNSEVIIKFTDYCKNITLASITLNGSQVTTGEGSMTVLYK